MKARNWVILGSREIVSRCLICLLLFEIFDFLNNCDCSQSDAEILDRTRVRCCGKYKQLNCTVRFIKSWLCNLNCF